MDEPDDAPWHQALDEDARPNTQVALLQNILRFHSCAYKDDEVKLRMRKGEKVCNERPLPKLLQDCATCDVQPLKKR